MEMTNLQPTDFRVLLQEELIKRCRHNPQYSLRSFAKALDVSPSALTEMMNCKRPITQKSVAKLGLGLGLSMGEIKQYQVSLPMVEMEKSAKKMSFEQLTIDQYALISDWYHYAILELLRVKDFKPDNSWIARCLGISKNEVNVAVERLIRLELLKKDEEGNLIDISGNFTTNISGSLTSSAAKKLQKQILEQSIRALEELPIEVRNHTSMTMAIDRKDLPEAIKRITTFRRSLCDYLGARGTPTDVYQLSISLFPVTKIEKDH